jgi:predicted methyltransferase
MTQTKIKYLTTVLLSAIVCSILLTGCAGQKLSPDFDEAAVRAAAENVITVINDQQTDGLHALCTVQMRTALTDDVMKQIYEAIGEGGTFTEIEDMRVTGSTDKASGEEYAVVIAIARYELKKITFTISFTKQMKLAGLYYR